VKTTHTPRTTHTSTVSPASSHSARVLPLRARPIITATDTGPDFDVCTELAYHADSYTGDETFSFYNLPQVIRLSVDRLCERTPAKRPPSFRVGMACCVYGGLNELRQSPDVRKLMKLRSVFLGKTDDSVDSDDLLMLDDMITSFKVSVPDLSNSGIIRQQNVRFPKDLLNGLLETSSRLGLKSSELAKICALITLSEQPGVSSKQRAAMSSAVSSVLRSIARRAVIVRVLLNTMGVETPEALVSTAEDDNE
jgi:hypothetical protein